MLLLAAPWLLLLRAVCSWYLYGAASVCAISFLSGLSLSLFLFLSISGSFPIIIRLHLSRSVWPFIIFVSPFFVLPFISSLSSTGNVRISPRRISFFFFLCFRSLGTSGCRRTTIFTWNHFQKSLIADFPVSPWGGCTWRNDSTTNFHIFVWTGLMFLVRSPRVFWTRPEEEKFCFRRTDRNISGGPDLGCACVCLHRFYSSLVFFFFFLRIEPVRVFFLFARSLLGPHKQRRTRSGGSRRSTCCISHRSMACL